MFNKRIYCLILVLGNIFTTYSQTIINGVVKDSIGDPVPLISVFVKPVDKINVLAFGYTDTNGNYSIEMNSSGLFTLNFRGLSFKNRKIVFEIDSINPQKKININTKLQSSVFTLNEVIINTERVIIEKKDTISIKASEFLSGDEEVVEDVLKKLPGIEVTEEGTIKVQGKSIEKVMVEGDDLFNRGYKLLTKNLAAGTIDRVEILERFSENPLLKDVEDSDRVALNLTMKKNLKSNLFGNADLGIGTSQFYESKLNLISLNKKTKYYFFGNLNNVGNDPTGDIYQLIYPDIFSESNYIGDDQFASKFLDIGFDFLKIKKNKTNFNNAELASLNGIYNPSKRLKLKGLVFFNSDEKDFFRNRTDSYFLADNSFINVESYKLKRKAKNIFAKWDAIYDINKNARFEYVGKYGSITDREFSTISFNQENLNEVLNTDSQYFDQRATYTKKLNTNSAIQVTGRYIFDEKPQEYNVDNYLFEDLFTSATDIEAVSQLLKNKSVFAGVESSYFKNHNKYNINLKVGFSNKKNDLNSNLMFQSMDQMILNENLNFKNQLSFKISDLYAKLKYKHNFGKFSLRLGLEPHQIATKSDNLNNSISENSFYIIPSVGTLWDITKHNKLLLTYKFATRSLAIDDLYDGYMLFNYRNFRRGTGFFDLLKGNIFLANYRYGNWSSKFLINASLLYKNDKDYLSTNNLISPNYNQISSIVLNNKELLSFNISTDTFLNLISSNLKVNVGTSKTDFANIVNESTLREIKSTNYHFESELRSAFDGVFNFHYGTKWIRSSVKTINQNSNVDYSSFLDLDFNISKKFKMFVKNEYYFFNNIETDKDYFFTDVNFEYTFKKNGLKLKLSAMNIFNTDKFASYIITDTYVSNTSYRLLPRYVLLKVRFRF